MSGFKITIIVLTFIYFITWLTTDLFRTQSSIEVNPQLESALTPLDPNLDQDSLGRIQNLDDRARLVTQTTPRPTTTPRPSVVATPTPTPTPIATPISSNIPTPAPSTQEITPP